MKKNIDGYGLSEDRGEDLILFDNKDDLITRYVVSECSCVLEDEAALYAGCVVDKAKIFTEEVKGVFGSYEEAEDVFSNYKTVVKEVEKNGASEFDVKEYYIFEREFNIERAMQENKEITSEDDFDKLLQTDYLRMGEYVVHDTDMVWKKVSPFSDNLKDKFCSSRVRKELYYKLENELDVYMEDLKRSAPEGIIRRSYETVMKQELVWLFYPDEERYSLDEIKALKNCDNSLDTLYHRWMDIDLNLNELLEDSVNEIVSDLAYSVERHSKLNDIENNDNVKMRL